MTNPGPPQGLMVSQALAEIINLRHAADAHKASDCGADCNVSLFTLKMTAQRLLGSVNYGEWAEAKALLSGWPL